MNKPALALETLHDLLTSRKHRCADAALAASATIAGCSCPGFCRTWSPVHEDIMFKFLDLCMSLKRGFDAKDGLHQFKNIAGQTAVSSFEKVGKSFPRVPLAPVALPVPCPLLLFFCQWFLMITQTNHLRGRARLL